MLQRATTPTLAILLRVALAQFAFFWFGLNPLTAQTTCGQKAVVQRGDTLSQSPSAARLAKGACCEPTLT